MTISNSLLKFFLNYRDEFVEKDDLFRLTQLQIVLS